MTNQETNQSEKNQRHFINFSNAKRNKWSKYRRYGV